MNDETDRLVDKVKASFSDWKKWIHQSLKLIRDDLSKLWDSHSAHGERISKLEAHQENLRHDMEKSSGEMPTYRPQPSHHEIPPQPGFWGIVRTYFPWFVVIALVIIVVVLATGNVGRVIDAAE